MDELDFEIMNKLLKDSQRPFIEIAKELKISADTVTRRYNKMKKSGAFKPVLWVNNRKFGFEAGVWYMISVTPQAKASVVEQISKIKNIIYIIKAVGDYDILAIAIIKNVKHMFEIGEQLNNITGVTKIDARLYGAGKGDPKLGKAFLRGFYRANNGI